jgi:hypothetical protein
MHGQLNPHDFIELKLTLIAANQPSVYEGEIECTITWDNKGRIINYMILFVILLNYNNLNNKILLKEKIIQFTL